MKLCPESEVLLRPPCADVFGPTSTGGTGRQGSCGPARRHVVSGADCRSMYFAKGQLENTGDGDDRSTARTAGCRLQGHLVVGHAGVGVRGFG
jgi:hypothetical protein